MADSELPVLSNGAPEPLPAGPTCVVRLQRKLLASLVAAFFLCYAAMLIALLAANRSLAEDAVFIQAIAGSGTAVVVLCAVVGVAASGRHCTQVAGLSAVYVLAAVAFALLEPRFALALETEARVEFEFPAWLPCFIVLCTLPGLLQEETVPILVVGTLTNLVNFAFRLASTQGPEALLFLSIYEVGVITLAVRDYQAAHSQPLTPVLDLSLSKSSEGKVEGKEEPLASELEAIMLRLQRIHSNAEEAARTAEERQRAKESETLMKDLINRLRAKDIYGLEKLPRTLSKEDKTYIEENYLPPEVPSTGVRRKQRLKSGTSHAVIEPIRYSLTELIPLLEQLGKQWNFDTDFLTTCSDSRPVAAVGDYLFRALHLTKRLNLKHESVWAFFEKLEQGYLPNAYHSSTHAADVMYSLMFLSKSSGLLFYSSDLEVAACVVATLGHDVGHLGYNNRFLVNSGHALAVDCE